MLAIICFIAALGGTQELTIQFSPKELVVNGVSIEVVEYVAHTTQGVTEHIYRTEDESYTYYESDRDFSLITRDGVQENFLSTKCRNE